MDVHWSVMRCACSVTTTWKLCSITLTFVAPGSPLEVEELAWALAAAASGCEVISPDIVTETHMDDERVARKARIGKMRTRRR